MWLDKQDLNLSIREWTCKNGHKLDRYLNAAKNILNEGLKIYRQELAITKVERKSDFGNKAHSMKPEAHRLWRGWVVHKLCFNKTLFIKYPQS